MDRATVMIMRFLAANEIPERKWMPQTFLLSRFNWEGETRQKWFFSHRKDWGSKFNFSNRKSIQRVSNCFPDLQLACLNSTGLKVIRKLIGSGECFGNNVSKSLLENLVFNYLVAFDVISGEFDSYVDFFHATDILIICIILIISTFKYNPNNFLLTSELNVLKPFRYIYEDIILF